MKKLLCIMLMLCMVFGTVACRSDNIIGGNETSDNKITILTTAVAGTPTTDDDPYKKYLLDEYGLDVTLTAATDFDTQATLLFSDPNTMPDLVAFTNITSFRTIFNQGVLLDDWTPYLDSMPNIKTIVETEDADRPGEPSVARLMLTEEDDKTGKDKLTGVWTLPDPPSWSLKIREDWAEEYRKTTVAGANYPAGSIATDGGEWQPNTPEDLLNFARWIRDTKNTDPAHKQYYGFTTAGLQTDFGVLGTWIPLMYGAVCQLPWGIYFTEDGKADFGITDGTHKKMLDFIKTIIEEELIEPNWYYNSLEDKTSTKGYVGIEWYTSGISDLTQAEFMDEDGNYTQDTTNWWSTYPVPKDPASPMGGYQASDGFFGKILSVSVAAANDKSKMEKITKLLNDLAVTKSVDEDGNTTYNRSATYDALRWGVGVEEDLQFKDIPGTNKKLLYTDPSSETGGYRAKHPGAWDWGTFFLTTDDGVLQSYTMTDVNALTAKIVESDERAASYTRRLQYGGVLRLDTNTVNNLTRDMQAFEYSYVTSKWSAERCAQEYDAYRQSWINGGGSALLTEAEKQFRQLGFIQ